MNLVGMPLSRKNIKYILILLVILVLIISYIAVKFTNSYDQIIKIGNKEVFVEVADTEEELTRGLMGRTDLPEDHGMLFVFPKEAQHSFWMKDTLIPLDLIFIDKDYRVVDIKENFQPCEEEPCDIFRPENDVMYVLEVNAGFVEKHSIREGIKIEVK